MDYSENMSKRMKFGMNDEMQNDSVCTRWSGQPVGNDGQRKRGRGRGTGRGRGRSKANPSYSSPVLEMSSINGESETLLSNLKGLSEREKGRMDRLFNSYQQHLTNNFNDFLTLESDDKVIQIETRISLTKLALANKNLSAQQKIWIEEVGFLSITNIKFTHLDRELIRWILGQYKPDERVIVMDDIWEIDISELEVFRALGLSNSGDDVPLTGKAGVDKYRNYFTINGGRIDIIELGKKVETLKLTAVLEQHKEEFLTCYLVYVFAVLLFPDTSLNIKVEYLNCLVDLDNLKNLNWAKLVIKKLNEGVKSQNLYVSGCTFLLQVIFYSRVIPKGSKHVVNLASTLPYVEQLTVENLEVIKSDFNDVGGYWNIEACADNASFHIPTQQSVFKSDQFLGEIKTGNGITPDKTEMDLNSVELKDGYETDNVSDEEYKPRKCVDENMTENRTGEYFVAPVVPPTIESRVNVLETIVLQLSDVLNTNLSGLNKTHFGNSHLVRERRQLLQEELQEFVSGVTETMILKISEIVSELISKDRDSWKASMHNLVTDLLSEERQAMTSSIKVLVTELLSEGRPSVKSTIKDSVAELRLKDHRTRGNGIDKQKSFVDLTNDETLFRKDKVVRCNPKSPDKVIMEFISDKNLSQSTPIIQFEGGHGLDRVDLETVEPQCLFKGSVIDCVSYMCTLNNREDRGVFASQWFFPATMTQYIIDGDKDDKTLLDYYFEGNHKFTNNIEYLDQVFLSVHDRIDHWFLVVIQFGLNVVEIFDTAPTPSTTEYRKSLAHKVVLRFDTLMRMWAGNDYRQKLPSPFPSRRKEISNFTYEYCDSVKQANSYDCGLYVCLLMMFGKGVQRLNTEAASVMARQNLLLRLYRHPANIFAWKKQRSV